MYELSAGIYDLMNRAAGKDYAAESAQVLVEIQSRKPDAATLLDVACGTSGHLQHLQHRFNVTGVELDRSMLEQARRRLPGVTLRCGDMRSFELDRRFDAVTCLFSAIGYMLGPDDLAAATMAMARHLVPGGVLIIEPWLHPAQWWDGHVVAEAANDTGVAVARASRSSRNGTISRFEFHYTVARARGVETFIEPHELRLWTVEEYAAAIELTGLEVHHDSKGLTGRGLFVGVAPGSVAGARDP